MDTHDVSEVSEYFQHLQKQKQNLQNAQSRKGQTPKQTKSRDQVIMQFMFRRMMATKKPINMHELRSSFVPPAYAPSTTPLSDLKKILINELTLETHHRGSYMLLRAVTPSDTMTAIMAIVEDEAGDVLMVQLYNQEEELGTNGRLIEGTMILIKEPYLKVMADGDYGLRVDHLSDIRFVPEHDILVPSLWRGIEGDDNSADYWKAKGNGHFNKAEYDLAIDFYSKALTSSRTAKETLTITLNRALTFLKTYQFDSALRDVETAIADSPHSEKALFRKSQALYHLKRFQESCEVHQILSKEYPSNATAKTEFGRATARLAEQQSGKYPFKQLRLEATKRRPPLLDRACYTGPVAVRPTEFCGRGLFTTEAVQAGDLLFCEKAFAHAFHDTADGSTGLSLLMNVETNTMTRGTQANLIGLIAQKLYKNPSLMPIFTDLYHGSYIPVDVAEVDGIPAVDTFLIERTISLNGFGCPLSSRDSHVSIMKEEGESQAQSSKLKNKFHSCGVWPLASYINHSCYSNTRRSFIGDMMIVRATQDIPANTELSFWYKSPMDHDLDKGGKQLDLRNWGFKCTCEICKDRGSTEDSELMKQKRLTSEMVKAFQALPHSRKPGPAIAKIEGIVSMLEGMYRRPASEIPRLGVWKAYLSLAAVHSSRNQPVKSIECALKTLESLGYVIEGGRHPYSPSSPLCVKKWGLMMDSLVGCWMALCGAYGEVAPDYVDRAEEYAKTTYRICVGEDETFGETYSRFAERVDGFFAEQ
ncbi:hypothetical protein BJX70DRAFT_409815 [Aspergillus crustosus]